MCLCVCVRVFVCVYIVGVVLHVHSVSFVLSVGEQI